MAISTFIADVWSATNFRNSDLAGYAETQIRKETRLGVQVMAGLALLILAGVAALLLSFGVDTVYIKTTVIFAILALHILVSAAFVKDVRSLHVLGMTFLVIGALAITFLAHQVGDLSVGMIAAIVMLFVAIPLVPWALREACLVIALTYLLLTSSLASVPGRFNADSFWVLQLLVFGVAVIGIVITGRNTFIRKHDLRARFALEKAHDELELVSMQDHLTGAWNRRYLQEQFHQISQTCQANKRTLHIAVLDIDNFKTINDTFGHQTGDEVLVAVVRSFVTHIAKLGRLIRLGGDEFLIIYWGADLDALIDRAVADLQRSSVARNLHENRTVTLSAGIVSSDPRRAADLESMYRAADKALYNAKHGQADDRSANKTDANLLAHTGNWKL